MALIGEPHTAVPDLTAPEPISTPAAIPLTPHARRALVSANEPPSVLSAAPNLPSLLYAARRRWRLALCLGVLLAASAAGFVWFLQPERFVARTLIHIASPPPLLPGVADSRSDFTSYQRTQIAYIKSRLVLQAALRDAKVASLQMVQEQVDPVAWLEKEIQADFTIAPEMLRIHLSGAQASELAILINAVREAYLKEVNQIEVKGRENRLRKLTEIHTELDQKVQEKRRLLKDMAENLGTTKDIKMMERTQAQNWKTLDTLDNELLQTRTKIIKLQMELKQELLTETKKVPATVAPKDIEDFVNKAGKVLASLKRIEKLDRDIEGMKKSMLNPLEEPAYKRTVAARQDADLELKTLREEARANFLRKLGESATTRIPQLRADIELCEKQVKWLSEEVDTRLKGFQDQKRNQINVEWLRDDIAVTEDLAKRVTSQKQILEMDMQAPERFRVLEEATSVPDKDTRIKRAGLAGGGMFGLVVFCIAFLEFRRRRVSSVDDVVHGLKLRLVGALPALPQRPRGQITAMRSPKELRVQDRLTESVESARTMLLHAAQAEAMRLIAVTSAVGGEGKTVTCSQLAASLARSGRRTLLIDADLRRPALHKVFRLEGTAGLSELLRGEIALAAAIQETALPRLSLITAGASDDRAIQALTQPVLGDVLVSLKGEFDFVIVDTAPVLLVADTEQISQRCDGVLLAILQDVSRLPEIYAAQERLSALRIQVLGAIVNGADQYACGFTYAYPRNDY